MNHSKSVIAISLALAIIFILSGCNQVVKVPDQPENAITLFQWLNPNEGQVYEIREITEVTGEHVQEQKFTTLWVPKGIGEYVLVEQVLLKASKVLTPDQQAFHGTAEYELCSELPSSEKQKVLQVYKDGTVKDSDRINADVYFPQVPLDSGRAWKFGGLNFSITGPETYNLNGTSYPAERIEFSGNPKDKNITGYAVFDVENHRIAKFMRTTIDGNTATTVERTLAQVIPNMKPADIDYSCLNTSIVN